MSLRSRPPAPEVDRPTRRLPPGLVGWLGAMVCFTTTWVVLGFRNEGYTLFDTVIEDYSPVSQPISGLGLGSTSTAMNMAFVIYGAFAIAGARSLTNALATIDPALRRPAAVTLGMHGLGAILLGVFTLELMELHSVGFLFVLAPIVGFALIGRRLGRRAATRMFGRVLVRVAAPLSALLVVGFFVSFDPAAAGDGEGIAGLIQRALVLDLQLWVVGLGVIATASQAPTCRGPRGDAPLSTPVHGDRTPPGRSA